MPMEKVWIIFCDLCGGTITFAEDATWTKNQTRLAMRARDEGRKISPDTYHCTDCILGQPGKEQG